MWKLSKNMCLGKSDWKNEPTDQEFFEYFMTLAFPVTAEYFDHDKEKSELKIFGKCDNDSLPLMYNEYMTV